MVQTFYRLKEKRTVSNEGAKMHYIAKFTFKNSLFCWRTINEEVDLAKILQHEILKIIKYKNKIFFINQINYIILNFVSIYFIVKQHRRILVYK